MNLVGKIFTVVIFLMCIVFSSFALMVHAAHKHWREVAYDYSDKLDKANEKYDNLMQELKRVEEGRKDDQVRAETRIKDLDSAKKNVTEQYEKEHATNVKLEHDLREYVAVVDSVNQNLKTRIVEIDSLHKENLDAVNERQQVYNTAIKLTDDVTTANAEVQRLQEALRGLADVNKRLKTLVEYAKLREADMAKDPPGGLTGEVTAVPRPDVVEISVGFDDGVRKGHKFAVTRPSLGNKYIGDIEVIQVNYPNRAVCRPDKTMQRDQIQKGDYVQANLTKRR